MIRLGAVEQSKLGRFSWILFQQDDLSYIFEKIEYIIFVITTNSAYILKIIIFTCKAKRDLPGQKETGEGFAKLMMKRTFLLAIVSLVYTL